MKRSIVIRESSISGKGIFAARDFETGEIILRWNPLRILSSDELAELSSEEKHYVSFVEGKYLLMNSPERYINHSCDPNTHVIDMCDVALRDIKIGEEITSDYSTCDIPQNKFECSCKSKNCRKIL
ncbi:SET domain-containing protein [Candidatus Micrarchaeota archaeon]|nr:SET domain-containing protein [Candidatus Micrarchaeota archaeon]